MVDDRPEILIVEDSPLMRFQLKDILEEAGYVVVGEAEDGRQGIEKYTELEPDLVTMDILMPGVNGITALKAIKKRDPEAKVVMITTVRNRDKVLEAVKIGAEDYVVKPFEEEKVLEKIEGII